MSKKLRVVVLGEKPQGAAWLTHLIDSQLFDIVAGVARRNSNNVWWQDEYFALILNANGIPVVRRSELVHFEYDIIWSLMYGFIIEPELISKSKVGLNLHESPLPNYRGCNGYSHAILENEPSYGTSFHLLAPDLDTGDLIDQEIFGINPNETAKELYVRTMMISELMFKKNMHRVAAMDIDTTPLDIRSQTVRQRSSLMDLKQIPGSELACPSQLYRRLRALDFVPFEPCYFYAYACKHYVFLNNSLGRLDHSASVGARTSFEGILDNCNRTPSLIVEGLPRDLVVMSVTEYQKHYSIFVPEYSWVGGKK